MTRAFVVAILGAESTGKTALATRLVAALQARGLDAVVVDEYLREFCARERRTPRRDEQQHIAAEQTRRIDAAAHSHAFVVADTSALMIAVYSERVFGDRGLYEQSLEAHRRLCDLTLITALDLPWEADGLQRDGEHVRAPVDALLRAALTGARLPFCVVGGAGDARVGSALRALDAARRPASAKRWVWACDRCDDGTCELHLLATTGKQPR